MKCQILPILAAVPFFVISCEQKSKLSSTLTSPENTETAPTPPPAATSVILAKRGYLPPAGTKAKLEASTTMTDSTLQVDAGGQQMEGTSSQIIKAEETLEFLSDIKIRRTIVSRKTTGKAVIAGMDQPIPEKPVPLEGKPVIIEKKDGKWTATLENGNPAAGQAAEIEKMADTFNRENDLAIYGESPRKIGEKWSVDASKIEGFGEMEKITGTYAVEFLRIEDYESTSCAVIKAEIDLKGKTAEVEGQSMNMRIRGDVTSHRSLKDMGDLQTKISGTIDLDGTPAPSVSIHMEGPLDITQKLTITRP